MFITEQKGRVRIAKAGVLQPQPFLDITAVAGCNEGLFSIAFSPHYATDGLFFVQYATKTCGEAIARYHVSASDPDVADPASAAVILSLPTNNPNGGDTGHYGGQLAFGPDGYLYTSFGDGSSGGDPAHRAQNPSLLWGKILRLDVFGGAPYAIPPTNPFVGVAGYQPEIWALGLRNPWRFSFDDDTGDLYIGDVGESMWEEVDVQPAGDPGGHNYGWSVMEGTGCFRATTCSQAGMTLPVTQYDHTLGCSISGGVVYRGSAMPAFDGAYLFGDYCSGRIWGLTHDGAGWHTTELAHTGLRIVSFGEDESGEVWVTDISGNAVYRLTDTAVPTDLGISQSESADPTNTGKNLTYSVTVTNHGTVPALDVTLTDQLPSTAAFVSKSISKGTCPSQVNKVITCLPGTIAPGATVTLNVVVKPPAAGVSTNAASVVGNAPDPVPGNNSSSESTTVVQETLAVNDVTVTEGYTGTKTATFTISRSNGAGTATVVYKTANGTAVAGSDYIGIAGLTATFVPGQTQKAVGVTIKGDTTIEPDERFFLNLSAPTGATIADGSGTGTISNDDSSFAVSNVSTPEGQSGTKTVSFTITRLGSTTHAASVQYKSANGTATAGSDYIGVPLATATFAPGVSTVTVPVTIKGDVAKEITEYFVLLLSSPVGAPISDGSGTCSIVNDD
jgi:uncharacterized repeat protein (TIGR01451 family)